MSKLQSSIDLSTLKFDDKGLIPAVIQDQISGKVLMLAWMNSESIEKTLETGRTWFFSRSRQKLWNKGEESGHFQDVVEAFYDCDADSLLFKVRQEGPACHTGEYSCFHNALTDNSKPDFTDKSAVLREVFEVVMQRKRTNPDNSYVAKKMREGIDRILKKVGEEAGEVIIAAKNANADEIGWEMADLIFHMWLVLGYFELTPDLIYDRLMERRK